MFNLNDLSSTVAHKRAAVLVRQPARPANLRSIGVAMPWRPPADGIAEWWRQPRRARPAPAGVRRHALLMRPCRSHGRVRVRFPDPGSGTDPGGTTTTVRGVAPVCSMIQTGATPCRREA